MKVLLVLLAIAALCWYAIVRDEREGRRVRARNAVQRDAIASENLELNLRGPR